MQNGWTDLNDLYVCDVFPGKDVTFVSVVDNAAHLQGQIPKTSIVGACIGIFKPLVIGGGWLFAVCRCIGFWRFRVKRFLRVSVLSSVHTTRDYGP